MCLLEVFSTYSINVLRCDDKLDVYFDSKVIRRQKGTYFLPDTFLHLKFEMIC